MDRYEGMFIFRPELTKENLSKSLSQVQELLEKNNGSMGEVKEWGKQRLAYPIAKCKEGVYYLVTFNIVPGAIAAIRRAFSLNESILRSLIVKI